MKLQQKSDFLSTRVQYISTTRIRPNPQQPRRNFPEDALAELAESIRCYGILQPLTVRRAGGDFELIAGERRLRAARLAGLREVPCLIARVGEEDSALLALIENLQRRDLDYWEEADALARLIRRYDLTQEQAAEKLGKSQSTVANKLRLLRLPESVRAAAQKYALTERHARALLRLPDGEEQRLAVERIGAAGWNVAQTEAYVEKRLAALRTIPPKGRSTYIIKDVRLFLNSVDRGLRLMHAAGIPARWNREDTDGEIQLTISIPKRREARERVGTVTEL